MKLAALTAVEEVVAGDVVQLPNGVEHVVTKVDRYPTLGLEQVECFVVVYAAFETSSYERKARDRSGLNVQRQACERGLKPLKAGELVPLARRGDLESLREARELLGLTADELNALDEEWLEQTLAGFRS